jgi:hypothetical protein
MERLENEGRIIIRYDSQLDLPTIVGLDGPEPLEETEITGELTILE